MESPCPPITHAQIFAFVPQGSATGSSTLSMTSLEETRGRTRKHSTTLTSQQGSGGPASCVLVTQPNVNAQQGSKCCYLMLQSTCTELHPSVPLRGHTVQLVTSIVRGSQYEDDAVDITTVVPIWALPWHTLFLFFAARFSAFFPISLMLSCCFPYATEFSLVGWSMVLGLLN